VDAGGSVTAPPDGPDPFDVATSVAPRGDGTFDAVLDERYTIAGMPNGGYLLALAARAAAAHLAELDGSAAHCLAASAAYARAMQCGPATIRVTVDRRGARVSQLHAEIEQAGRSSVRALLSMGRLRPDAEVQLAGPSAVGLPDRASCERLGSGGPPGSGISTMDRVELLLDPRTSTFLRGERSDEPEVRGWIRLSGDRPVDSFALLFLTDTLPPSTLPYGSTGWTPTIQLSVYVRREPTTPWLAARQYARSIGGGLLDQGCELWDETGALVATATQLAMVRFRR
jgi:acyl-CoA thioesterase